MTAGNMAGNCQLPTDETWIRLHTLRRDKLQIGDCGLNRWIVISEEEALERILSAVSPLPPREVFLGDALDRFAAANLFATIPLPPFDNSAMDGYAVLAESATKDTLL